MQAGIPASTATGTGRHTAQSMTVLTEIAGKSIARDIATEAVASTMKTSVEIPAMLCLEIQVPEVWIPGMQALEVRTLGM